MECGHPPVGIAVSYHENIRHVRAFGHGAFDRNRHSNAVAVLGNFGKIERDLLPDGSPSAGELPDLLLCVVLGLDRCDKPGQGQGSNCADAERQGLASARCRCAGVGHDDDVSAVRVLHPQSCIAPDAVLGFGVFVASFATIQPGSRIGNFACIRSGAHISHDTSVGDFAFVGPNASLAGRSSIAACAHIGSNATVREHLTVGAFAIVGIGAVVIKSVDAHQVVVGNPARPLTSCSLNDLV